MRVLPSACVALALATVSSSAHAQRGQVRELRHDAAVDSTVAATATALWITSEILKRQLVPAKCRWCYRDARGEDALNVVDRGVRRALVWRDTHTADLLSSALAFGAMPASSAWLGTAALAHDDARGNLAVDGVLVAEATALAMVVNQLAKFTFARERPFVHERKPIGTPLAGSPRGDNLSFFSGHTTFAFALATATGTVAQLRGYRLSPVLWSTGLLGAAAVGYLRIAADRHYFSDVVVGMLVGSLIGAGVPLLFHRPRDERAGPAPSEAAQPLMFSFGSSF